MKNEQFNYKLMKLKWELAGLNQMKSVLKNKKEVAIFHAQKSLYIYLKEAHPVIKFIIYKLVLIFLNGKIKKVQKQIKEIDNAK